MPRRPRRFPTLVAAILALAVPAAAAEGDIKFFDFKCDGLERNKGALIRRERTADGDLFHEFECVDRSCFRWSVENPGSDTEAQLVEHLYIKEKEHAYVFSWILRKKGAEKPVFRYSRVKQMLNCTSPAS